MSFIATMAWIIPLLAIGIALAVRFAPWETGRRIRHATTIGCGAIATVLALAPLVLLSYYLLKAGLPGLTADFFTQAQKPLGEPGSGMKHAILGSLVIVGIASAIGIPVGIMAGIYLSEYGKGRLAATIRFLTEVMTGLPSIIAGILGYILIVARFGQFSAFAGSIALSILMMPIITRVTEESLRLVPSSLREASLALGVGNWRTIWSVVLPAAKSGILTGVVLAVARVGGETAPLLFTTAGQSMVNWDPTRAMAALPLSIYLNANQPFAVSKQLAISGALFLVLWIAVINIIVRWIGNRTRVPGF